MTTLILVIVCIVLFFAFPVAVVLGAIGLWLGGTIGCVVGASLGFLMQAAA